MKVATAVVWIPDTGEVIAIFAIQVFVVFTFRNLQVMVKNGAFPMSQILSNVTHFMLNSATTAWVKRPDLMQRLYFQSEF